MQPVKHLFTGWVLTTRLTQGNLAGQLIANNISDVF